MNKFSRDSSLASKKIGDSLSILDPNKGELITLRGTAVFLWENLDQPRSLEELVNQITQEFDVDPETAELDTKKFLESATKTGIISPQYDSFLNRLKDFFHL